MLSRRFDYVRNQCALAPDHLHRLVSLPTQIHIGQTNQPPLLVADEQKATHKNVNIKYEKKDVKLVKHKSKLFTVEMQ